MGDATAATAGLNFDLPEEIRMLKDTVRKFVDKELIPIERTARDGHKLRPEVRAHLQAKAVELGLAGYDVPTEYGGLGMGLVAKVTVWAELSRSIALPTRGVEIFGPNVSPILYHLDPEQKKKYLLPTIRGELNWCLAQTEPEAGGDPGGMRTTAVRHGDHYVINGVKRFITGARPWEITFEDVKVPVADRIGQEGDGFKHAQHWLNMGRIRHGARSMGVIERCLELGTRYAKQRVTFGQPLSERQAVQWMLADSFMELHQLRLMVYDAAWKYDQGRDIRAEAYMAKIFGDTQSFHAADRCMEIHGGMGLATDLPIEKFWRDQRSMMITEGPIEILKMTLARHVLRTYG